MSKIQIYKLTKQPDGVMKASIEHWDRFPDDDVIPFYAENGTPYVADREFTAESKRQQASMGR